MPMYNPTMKTDSSFYVFKNVYLRISVSWDVMLNHWVHRSLCSTWSMKPSQWWQHVPFKTSGTTQ